jgi:hypothetical protein
VPAIPIRKKALRLTQSGLSGTRPVMTGEGCQSLRSRAFRPPRGHCAACSTTGHPDTDMSDIPTDKEVIPGVKDRLWLVRNIRFMPIDRRSCENGRQS